MGFCGERLGKERLGWVLVMGGFGDGLGEGGGDGGWDGLPLSRASQRAFWDEVVRSESHL